MPKKKSSKRTKRIAIDNKVTCSTLASAAFALFALGNTTSLAQTNTEERSAAIQYYYFNDWQEGGDDRMAVDATLGRLATPLDASSSLQGTFVVDTMSGASPLYHGTLNNSSSVVYENNSETVDTVSGASKPIIEDQRFAGSLLYTKQFEKFEIQVGGEVSDENDYLARGGSLLATTWSDDKNRSYSIGLSTSVDRISSTINRDLDEGRKSWSSLFSLTQVIDPVSILQVNLQATSADGYLSDPYKSQDARPRSRESVALLTRYNRYLEQLDGAVHFDYRYFRDTWSIISHTVELSFHKEILPDLILRPLLRYYSQSESSFYSSIYPSEEEGFYSADQRMGGFGGISGGLKGSYTIDTNFSLQILYEFVHQNPRLKSGSEGSFGVPEYYAHFMGGGLQWRW